MKQCSITLIATRHEANGNCTSEALYQIIEQISPDAIFEEIPPSKFDALYQGLLNDTLESQTIKRYLKKYPIVHVPVDAEIDELTDIFTRSDYRVIVNRIFGRYSSEYVSIANQRQHLAERNGFRYLNSEHWKELSKRMDMLEEEMIKSINDDRLNQRYKEWLNVLDIRNNEMIRNIYKFIQDNKCENGLFLVGVEHRRQIIEKIPEFENDYRLKIDWKFNFLG